MKKTFEGNTMKNDYNGVDTVLTLIRMGVNPSDELRSQIQYIVENFYNYGNKGLFEFDGQLVLGDPVFDLQNAIFSTGNENFEAIAKAVLLDIGINLESLYA